MYEYLARILLNGEDYVHFTSPRGEFGFEWQRKYTGIMAQPSRSGRNRGRVARAKQGLFDIVVTTGSLFGQRGVSHRDLLEGLRQATSLEKCFSVWRGEDPLDISETTKERECLTTLMLLFFEQEVNWGNESWQRFSFFNPRVTRPNKVRPRDMLMGFVSQSYDLGIDNIAYWMQIRPTTTTFKAPDNSNYGYEDYSPKYKGYFTDLENDSWANALMVGNMRSLFRKVAETYANNPYYQG